MRDYRSPGEPRSAVQGLGWPAVWTAVFVATGVIGVWAAYDRPAASHRFGLILTGMLVALVVAGIGQRAGEPGLALVGLGCALLAAALAGYFLLTFDWQARGVVKVPALYQAGLWLQGHRPAAPIAAPEDIHSNVAGGALVLLLPLAGGAMAWAWKRWPWPAVVVGCAATGLALVGLLLTTSRGAWLGLALGALLAAYPAVRCTALETGRSGAVKYGLLAFLVLLAATIPCVTLSGRTAAAPFLEASTTSRTELWRWGLDLITDYPFTGSGLGSTMLVHATYVRILHVGFISHMHNLLIQIAVEQGIPGLIAFTALVVLAVVSLARAYRAGAVTPLFAGATAALAAMLIHGAVDAGVYASLAVPVSFLPIGFALGLAPARQGADRPLTRPVAASVITALSLAVLLLPSTRSAFLANMGAVAQTRAELSHYHWPEVPVQDALRRSLDVDLEPAIARYRAALALEPANATANRRLGQIELSRGEREVAREHLERAYRAAPEQTASRFLLGESLAIEGQIEEAAALWEGVEASPWWPTNPIDRQVIMERRWWYGDALQQRQRAEYLAQAADLAGLQ
jgi:putative inorganic carbon (HCO3(-)) transporter